MMDAPRDPGGLRNRIEQAMGDGPILGAVGWNRTQILPVVVVAPADGPPIPVVVQNQSLSGWGAWVPAALVAGSTTDWSLGPVENGKPVEIFMVGTDDDYSINMRTGDGSAGLPIIPGGNVNIGAGVSSEVERIIWIPSTLPDAGSTVRIRISVGNQFRAVYYRLWS